MNGGGRQGLRSAGGTTGVHHQRQYSENFLDGATTGNRWLQSAGLQHLQSSAANPLQVRFINFLILHFRDDLVKLMIILIWFDLIWLWLCNASRIITCTAVAERKEGECIGMFREALMAEEVIIIWSRLRLLMLTVLQLWRWTVMIRTVILVLACWICIRLILSFFLRLLLFMIWYLIWLTVLYFWIWIYIECSCTWICSLFAICEIWIDF